MVSIARTILKFYSEIQRNPHHRYKSWEHCYKYFCLKDPEPNYACLHLAFYLASWGMYRGSSFLLDRDYQIHLPIVGRLLTERNSLQGKGVLEIEEKTDHIFELIAWIEKQYDVPPTDTLVTKILLGTLACTPAYDINFVKGLRLKKLNYSRLNVTNFKAMLDFVKRPANLDQFEEAQAEIKGIGETSYPIMKLVDMYFWQLGTDDS